MSTNNSIPTQKKGRFLELDLLKTFTIIFCMIPVHCWLAHTTLFETTFTEAIDTVLGGILAAPFFMFCMGIGFVFTRRNSPKEIAYRGIKLLTYGALLSWLCSYLPSALAWEDMEDMYEGYRDMGPEFDYVKYTIIQSIPSILTIDILEFAGLAFLLSALLERLHFNDRTIALTSIVLCFIGSLFRTYNIHFENPVANQALCYFVFAGPNSCFPLFTWFIFVAFGRLFGRWYITIEDKSRIFRWIIPIGAILATAYCLAVVMPKDPIFHLYESEEAFYGMTLIDALAIIILSPFYIGVWWLISKVIPESWTPVLSYPSRHINQFYCISWLVIIGLVGYARFYNLVPDNSSLSIDSIIVIAITSIIAVIYNKFLVTKVETFLAKHNWFWIAVVWVLWIGAIIIFNIAS